MMFLLSGWSVLCGVLLHRLFIRLPRALDNQYTGRNDPLPFPNEDSLFARVPLGWLGILFAFSSFVIMLMISVSFPRLPLFYVAWMHLTVCVFAMAALMDARTQWLPDALTLPLLWSGLLWSTTPHYTFLSHEVLWGAAMGYGLFRLVDEVFLFIRKRPALGGGDAKLAGALGAFLGPSLLPWCILIACMLTIVVRLLKYWVLRGSKGATESLTGAYFPFGPGLIVAGGLTWWLGPMLIG